MSRSKKSSESNSDLPEILIQGQRARLFPTVSDTSRENRLTSIFLAILPHIPELAKDLFSTIGLRVGTRASIECWTEVVLSQSEHLDKRPDGLIIVRSGKTKWSALVETKIKKVQIDSNQISKYVEVARDSGINAVITISNQFVARADLSPVSVSKVLLRKTDLYHWSWTYIRTRCEILFRDAVEDTEQSFMLGEFLRLLDHKDTGVERFTAMNRSWRELVQTVSNQGVLKKNSPEVEECVGCWHQEERDLCLQLSRSVGTKVTAVIGRKHLNDPVSRLKDGVSRLVDDKLLSSSFRIPDCAADIEASAYLMSRTLTFSMKLRAPLDRKSTKARVNWLLRMLPEDDNRLVLRAHWPSRTEPTDKSVEELREDPGLIQNENSNAVPHSFEILLIDYLGVDFSGRQKFIERVEVGITNFYDLVGQHLRAWQPAPPKPIKGSSNKSTEYDVDSDSDDSENKTTSEDT